VRRLRISLAAGRPIWLKLRARRGNRPLERQDRPVSGYGSIAALIRLGTLPGAAALGLLTLLLTSP